jgi:hypothetical protein
VLDNSELRDGSMNERAGQARTSLVLQILERLGAELSTPVVPHRQAVKRVVIADPGSTVSLKAGDIVLAIGHRITDTAGDITGYAGKVRLMSVGFGEVATAIGNAAVAAELGGELFPGHSTELEESLPIA